jgi:hypothetical protein
MVGRGGGLIIDHAYAIKNQPSSPPSNQCTRDLKTQGSDSYYYTAGKEDLRGGDGRVLLAHGAKELEWNAL